MTFKASSEDYRVEIPAVAVLAIAGAGALLTVVWPLAPKLLPLAPLGALLALSGWFLVISRRSGKGPDEFLESIQVFAGRAEEFSPPETGI